MNKKGPSYDTGMWKGAPPHNFERARVLRDRMTAAELKLWSHLKEGKLNGMKFRRQHPIQFYIADFYCHKFKLVVEIDGEYHNEVRQQENDRAREEILKFQDLKIIRFTNDQVLQEIDKVLNQIKNNVEFDFPTPACRQAGFREG